MTPTPLPRSLAERLLDNALQRLPAPLLAHRWMRRLLEALPLRAPAPAAGASEAPPAEPAADDDRPRGCGWFDSSLDLQQGLRVQEHTGLPGSEPGLADLPLAAWLELQLHGWRPEAPQALDTGFTPAT
jgi:hypothetical protein